MHVASSSRSRAHDRLSTRCANRPVVEQHPEPIALGRRRRKRDRLPEARLEPFGPVQRGLLEGNARRVQPRKAPTCPQRLPNRSPREKQHLDVHTVVEKVPPHPLATLLRFHPKSRRQSPIPPPPTSEFFTPRAGKQSNKSPCFLPPPLLEPPAHAVRTTSLHQCHRKDDELECDEVDAPASAHLHDRHELLDEFLQNDRVVQHARQRCLAAAGCISCGRWRTPHRCAHRRLGLDHHDGGLTKVLRVWVDG